MLPAAVELPLPEPPPGVPNYVRFSNLRGVRWRIDLGILPSSPAASVEELRRVAADCRRRYASLRRHLLIDPHLFKDGSRSPDLTMDNPLSQNPDSTWGRFFRNAELEKLVDQDLSRLYPERENYFQMPACQAILRRILLVWCLRHPEYGYRQGMHELLAPLLYVLHVDLQHLSQVRALYEDCFNDEFDEMIFPDGDLPSYLFTNSSSRDSRADSDNSDEEGSLKITSLDELDPETKGLFLLSDAYGAEGELGVILSERFMEHDAYCMFDGLMSGTRGVVAMADFFSPSPLVGSSMGLPPVIEASSALYYLLSTVDSSLHRHLIELGVEPQYFALRWLRVLFGREFSLDDLLLIWDKLFSSSNTSVIENEPECSFKFLCCPRGAFISAMAVSMLLHQRSTLLATENTTTCLQRLLNFPENIDVKNLIEKAKSWQALAIKINISSSPAHNNLEREIGRIRSLPTNASSTGILNQSLPDRYWEEKWRKEMATQKSSANPVSRGNIKKLLGDKFGLIRTESDPSPAKKDSRSPTVRRLLFDDITDVDNKSECSGGPEVVTGNESPHSELDEEKSLPEEPINQSITERMSDCMAEETCLSGENYCAFSTPNSPQSVENEHDNDSEKSSSTSHSDADNDGEANQVVKGSVTSNSLVANCEEVNRVEEIRDLESTSITKTAITSHSSDADNVEEANQVEKGSITSNSSIAENREEVNRVEVRDLESALIPNIAASSKNEVGFSKDGDVKQGAGVKERKLFSGKFQWLLRFGKGLGEGNLEKGASGVENLSRHIHGSSISDCNSCGDTTKTEVGDKKVMGTLKNVGQSILENIQVIESVFQQDRGQAGNMLGSKGQATAMAALKELRNISNLLSEM